MMNLLDLFISIGVRDDASSAIDKISASAIAKAQLAVDGIKTAISTLSDAFTSVVGGAVDAYSEYQQQVGGMETFFGDAADTVIENAKRAYETAGMSANQYMKNASSFATTLIQDIAKKNAGVTQQAADEEVKTKSDALDQEYADLQRAQGREETLRSRAQSHQLTQIQRQQAEELSSWQEYYSDKLEEYQEELAAEQAALEEAFDAERQALVKQQQENLEGVRRGQADALKQRQRSLRDEYDSLKESLDDQYDAVREQQAKVVDEYRKATDERIRQINREYTESLKLVDEEEYRRVKAIQDQIDALDDLTKAERKEIREQQQQERIADLQNAASTAKTAEERERAEKNLQDYLAQIAQEQREEDREQEKEGLRDQISLIQEQADKEREALTEKKDSNVEVYEQQRAEELASIQESMAEQLKEIQKANQRELQDAQDSNADILEEFRQVQADEIAAIQEADAKREAEMRAGHEAQLKALQESNGDKAKEYGKWQQEQLRQLQYAQQDNVTAIREGQQDQLTEFREGQQRQLEALKDSINAQRQTVADGSALSEYIKATYEDQKQAADLIDVIMTDMSDNANKMGTDMGMIENAYQGFAKQNFTMLDNLKLGFGGTKEEMERLLSTAESISAKNGEMRDFSIDSFADIAEAIHVVQTEYEVSGMSAEEAAQAVANGYLTQEEAVRRMGTTAKEGSTTVQGSFMQMYAAWENFLVALGDPNGDVDGSLDALLATVDTYLNNLIPILSHVLDRLIPIVVEKGTTIAHQLWDSIYSAIPEENKQQFNDIIDAIEGIGHAVIELSKSAPLIATFVGGLMAFNTAKSAVEGVQTVLSALSGANGVKGAADAVEAAGDVVEAFTPKLTVLEGGASTAKDALGGVGQAAGEVVGSIPLAGTAAEGAGAAFGGLGEFMAPLVGPAGLIVAVGGALLYLVGTNDQLMESIRNMVTDTEALKTDTEVQTAAMGTSWTDFTGQTREELEAVASQVKVNTSSMGVDLAVFGSSVDEAKEAVKTGASDISKSTTEASTSWKNGWSGMESTSKTSGGNVKKNAEQCAEGVQDAFKNSSTMLEPAGFDIINGLWEGMKDVWSDVSNWVGDIAQWIADNKGPEEYDKKLLVPAGRWIMGGFREGLENAFEHDVMPYVGGMADRIERGFGTPVLAPSVGVTGTWARMGQVQPQSQPPRNQTVVLQIDRTEFGRVVYQLNDEETQRIGVRLTREVHS